MSILIIRDNNQSSTDLWEIDGRDENIFNEFTGKNYEVLPVDEMDETNEEVIYEDDEGKRWHPGSEVHQALSDIFHRRIPHRRLNFPLSLPHEIFVDYVSFTY